ncbi:MAG TPA: TetR/AcrR family transcriptional regulator [Acidimicrobiia bacterium]|nr:TetR/AcrR family transcriptional regulator [Acidimicrobiia bacterium]
MQNVVPVERAVAARTLEGRTEAYADEVRRLVDAAYAVMRRTGTVEPRVADIVIAAGLSNQAFYRHFRGKDELLLAVLEDGQRRLVGTLERRMARAAPGAPQVRAWIEGLLEQARNAEAAANTRPFAVNGARLTERYPEATAVQRERVVGSLRDAVQAAGGDRTRDADAIYALTMGLAEDAITRGTAPSDTDVAHTVSFSLRAICAETR